MARSARASRRPSQYAPIALQGSTLVDAIFARVGLLEAARSAQIVSAWPRVAGERIGRHARAERATPRTLYVRVASASWAQELGLLRGELLEQLRALPAGRGLRELRFSVGPLDEVPLLDPEPPPPLPKPVPQTRFTPTEDAALAVALRGIEDPQLRDAMAGLYARVRHLR